MLLLLCIYLGGMYLCSDNNIGGGEGTWGWVDGKEDKKRKCVWGK